MAKRGIWSRLRRLALTDVKVIARGGVDARSLDQLEELLLTSDFGTAGTAPLGDGGRSDTSLARAADGPTVFLVLGVNGAGKTTFIGKLATRLRREGRSVLVGA